MDEKKPHELSDEVLRIIRNDDFQKTADKFARKNDTIFKVLKGTGFTIALLSGLIGYLLKANSEADDRRAVMVSKIIEEKKDWVEKIVSGVVQLRTTRILITEACESGKPMPMHEQKAKRTLARFKLVESFVGVDEVFDNEVRKILVDLNEFDKSVKDVCAKSAPKDKEWRSFLVKVNDLMKQSIKKDRIILEKIGKGFFSEFFHIF